MAESKRVQLNSKIAQADQELSAAGIQRGYAQLRAPFAGVLKAIKCKVGDIVQEGVELAEVEPAAS